MISVHFLGTKDAQFSFFVISFEGLIALRVKGDASAGARVGETPPEGRLLRPAGFSSSLSPGWPGCLTEPLS